MTTPGSEPSAAEEEALLWQALRSGRDPAARQKLVERYLWLARTIALGMFRDRARFGDLDPKDLVQLGTVGLLEAVDRYEPDRGAGFSSFAKKRIAGAIVDGIDRSSDVRAQSAAMRELRRERLRSISAEAASTDRFERLAEITVGLAIGMMLEDTGMFSDESSPPASPYSSAETEILRQQVKQVVDSLPPQQQRVVRYHYYHEMSFAGIAELMGLSKTRVFQIHGQALAEIRGNLGETAWFDETA